MTPSQKIMLGFTYATASSALVGVILLALHTPEVWPVMLLALVFSSINAFFFLRRRSS